MANLTDPLGLGRVAGSGNPAADYNLSATQVNDLMTRRQQSLGMGNAYRDGLTIPDGVGIVALRHDDGPQNDYNIAFPALQARDLVGGFALIGKHYNPVSPGFDGGSVSGWLTPAMAQEMQHAGHEMMNHSRNHWVSNLVDPTSLYDDIIVNGDELRATGLYIDSFVRPGPWDGILDTDLLWDAPLGQAVRMSHAAAESYIADGWPNKIKTTPGSAYGTEPVGVGGVSTDLANIVTPAVEQAIAANGAVTFLTHTGGYGAAGSTAWNSYTAVLDYLQAQRDAGRIVVVTPSALNRARRGARVNLCPDPSFERYAVNSGYSQWSSSTATVVTGRTGGSALEVPTSGSITLSIGNVESLRTIEITGYAKATSTSATARIVTVQKQSTTTFGTKTKSVAVTSGGWTFFRTYMRMDPRATFRGPGITPSNTVQIQLAQSTAAVQYDDLAIYKS
jgi:hypothetical protein